MSNLEEIKKMAIDNGRMFDYYVQELLGYMSKEYQQLNLGITNSSRPSPTSSRSLISTGIT